MTQENTVSFKVFLQKAGSDDKPEVRRFGIDRDVVSNFIYLKEKLQAVFPTLRSKDLVVSWKDDEGDEIVISSDDELMIALTEMQTDVRKLYVAVSNSAEQNSSTPAGSIQHVGITCDGCDKAVEGFRYKCIQCPDYDLCASCEGKGMHSEHFMIRSPVQISWRPQFGRRLAHRLSKSSRRACPNSAGNVPGECPWRNQKHSTGQIPFLDLIGSYINTLVNPSPTEQGNHSQEQNEPSTSQNKTADNSTTDAEASHVAYLMNVGKTVAEMLDPLGIDVEVSVSDSKSKKTTKVDDGKKATKVDDENELPKEEVPSSNMKLADTEVPKSEMVEKSTPQALNEQKEKEGTPEPTETLASQSDRESPENDGWTVLNTEAQQNQNSDNIPLSGRILVEPVIDQGPSPAAVSAAAAAAANAAASAAANAAAAAMARAATGAIPKHNIPVYYPPPPPFGMPQVPAWSPYAPSTNMYPVLPPTPLTQAQATPSPSQRPLHSNPKIADAVQKMMAMGFSNEGGWLTQLLEIKEGDIVKALDVLQPVKK